MKSIAILTVLVTVLVAPFSNYEKNVTSSSFKSKDITKGIEIEPNDGPGPGPSASSDASEDVQTATDYYIQLERIQAINSHATQLEGIKDEESYRKLRGIPLDVHIDSNWQEIDKPTLISSLAINAKTGQPIYAGPMEPFVPKH